MSPESQPPAQTPVERILASASNVFARKGFLGGTLGEIATGSGLTKAGVIHHFASKEAILLALLTQRDQELDLTDGDGSLPASENFTLGELVGRIVEKTPAILARRELVELAHILTAEASHVDHPAHLWVNRRHARLRLQFAAAAAESRDRGEIAAEIDADEVAITLLGLIEGIEGQWLVAPESIDVQATLSASLERYLRALR